MALKLYYHPLASFCHKVMLALYDAVMARLAEEGQCILMISSEMPELLGMCDRICVMNEGRFVGEFTAAEATQEKIMRSIVAASH